MRIGHGYDVHRFCEGRPLMLGGVNVSCEFGLLGHSDADVLLHAICDALLGAAAKGDIGKHFPNNDDKYKNINSLILLKNVDQLLKSENYKIVNIDATIIAQAPKLSPYIKDMVKNIANALNIVENCVNVKATTEEGLGFTGEKLGIAAHAVCIIE